MLRKWIILKNKKELDDSYFQKYLSKNGYHFSNKLAEYASALMQNENSLEHSWNCQDVEQAIISSRIESNYTLGDLTYAANMAYADFFSLFNSEKSCIEYAIFLANDPDGYDGQIFKRWLLDIREKNITINWKNFT